MGRCIESLREMHGVSVTCEIGLTIVTDAKISVNRFNDKVYVCQNARDGIRAENRLGYNYSWVVSNGNESAVLKSIELAEESS